MRIKEYNAILHNCYQSWQAQNDILSYVYSSYTQIFWKAAVLFERHKYTSQTIDENSKFFIACKTDDNVDRISNSNNKIDLMLLEIRHAENENQLESCIQNVCKLLDELEKTYLIHFDEMKRIIDDHILEINRESSLHLGSVLQLLGLQRRVTDSNKISHSDSQTHFSRIKHPSFYGAACFKAKDLKPKVCLNGSVSNVNQTYGHPLQILQPDVKPLSSDASSYHPALFGYAVYRAEKRLPQTQNTVEIAGSKYHISKPIGREILKLCTNLTMGGDKDGSKYPELHISDAWFELLNIIGGSIPVDWDGNLCLQSYLPPMKAL